MQGMGLYIHVPFCMGKCPYCDFYSQTPAPGQTAAYTQALLRGLRHLPPQAAGRRLNTVYFGGGTPNLLGADNLCAVLEEVGKVFDLAPDAEVTTEANPGSITAEDLLRLRRDNCQATINCDAENFVASCDKMRKYNVLNFNDCLLI